MLNSFCNPHAATHCALPHTLLRSTPAAGRVEVYVTNDYVPQQSSSAYLPGRGQTLPCQWIAQNWTYGLSMSPGDPCYSASRSLYTIAVLGASFVPGLTTLFSIEASTGALRDLQLGVQRPMQYVLDNASECAQRRRRPQACERVRGGSRVCACV